MKKIVSLFPALVLVLNLGITAFAEETYTIFLKTEQTTAEVGQTVYVKVGSDQANRSHITGKTLSIMSLNLDLTACCFNCYLRGNYITLTPEVVALPFSI